MSEKPNILFILCDDLGPWALHCAGTKELHTPNIDNIAQKGMLFENFFCVSPVCSPARASLLTGTIPSAHGVHDWLRSGSVDKSKFERQGKQNPYSGGYRDEDKPIQYLAGKTTYTDVLCQNGYTCALSGKWHLGDSIHPQHGFSYWYTIGMGGCCYYHPDIVENGNITVEDGKYVTNLITDKALVFLDELSEKKQPFYLSVHYTAPHAPWGKEHHPAEFIDMYQNCTFESIPDVPDHKWLTGSPVYGTDKRFENLRGYFAAISAMDADVGRLLSALDKKGLTDNTIVIFTADNGMNMGHHGVWGKGNGTFPMNMYDTSVKVPFIISYPPMIRKGSRTDVPVSAYDFFPTILDMLGFDFKVTERLPGKSFVPALKGEQSFEGHVVVFDEYGPVRMIRSKKYKYVARYPYGENELYDLEKDPEENVNLIDDERYADIMLDMRCKLEKWFNDYVNPDIDGVKEGVTGLGQLCSAGIYAEKALKYAQTD